MLGHARQLSLASRDRHDEMLYEAMNGLAAVAAAPGEDELASLLIGAAEATVPYRRHPAISRQLEDRYFAPARARIGEGAWWAAHAAAAALTPRQAADAALHVHQIPSPESS